MSEFQGKKVSATKVQLTGGAKETFDGVPEIDQIVSIVVDGRVTGVDHRVNEQSGDLEQVVRVKVLDMSDVKTQTQPHMTVVDGRRMIQ